MNREERRRQTRQELLEAATRVFAARGFGGASIDDVAAEAGYTSGAIYSNFAGKEDLFLSAFEHQIARQVREVTEDVAAAGENAAERNRAAAAQWMRFLDESPELFLLFVEYWAYAVRDPQRREAFALRFATFREGTARMLGRAAEDPLPMTIQALVYGIAFQRLAEPDVVPDDLFAEALQLLTTGARRE